MRPGPIPTTDTRMDCGHSLYCMDAIIVILSSVYMYKIINV